MKNRYLLFLLFFTALFFHSQTSFTQKEAVPLQILLITGGHSFEEQAFHEVFESYTNISFDTISQPAANDLYAQKDIKKYDVLVFYDMWQNINERQKKAFTKLLKKGKGMVFMHHSLVSYQNWEEFTKIIGGKYIENKDDSSKNSHYFHDQDFKVQVLDKAHPVTQGLDDFQILDEGYTNIFIRPEVKLLLQVDHPNSAKNIGWTHQYKKSKIVYLLLGHDHHAFENESFRKLIENAIKYVAE